MNSTDYRTFPIHSISANEAYRLMAATIIPRPIAFVSTQDHQGVVNLAPFSFFTAVSHQPASLVFSVTPKSDGQKKDTLRNIEENGEFVVNSTHEWLAEKINQCSASYPYGMSELEKVGFTPIPSTLVKPPRIAEAMVQMECKLDKLVSIGDQEPGAAILVIGRILAVHVSETAFTGNVIDVNSLKPLSRLGGMQWGRTREVFDLTRPTFIET